MIWKSEAILYGLMIANFAAVALAMIWAWRRGHFEDLEGLESRPLANQESEDNP